VKQAQGVLEAKSRTHKVRPALPILAEACKLAGILFGNLNIDGKHTPPWLTVIILLPGLKSVPS
jgi:hypothetical protein